MKAIELNIKFDGLLNAIRTVPNKIEQQMGLAINLAGRQIARTARENVNAGPNAFGTLRNSIKDTQISAYETIIRAGVNYATAVELGRKPGTMPPVNPILDWIHFRKITPHLPNLSENGLAYIIAHKIKKYGTKAQPFLAPALESNIPAIEKNINAAIARALQ